MRMAVASFERRSREFEIGPKLPRKLFVNSGLLGFCRFCFSTILLDIGVTAVMSGKN